MKRSHLERFDSEMICFASSKSQEENEKPKRVLRSLKRGFISDFSFSYCKI